MVVEPLDHLQDSLDSLLQLLMRDMSASYYAGKEVAGKLDQGLVINVWLLSDVRTIRQINPFYLGSGHSHRKNCVSTARF